jgi:hypothetical protein
MAAVSARCLQGWFSRQGVCNISGRFEVSTLTRDLVKSNEFGPKRPGLIRLCTVLAGYQISVVDRQKLRSVTRIREIRPLGICSRQAIRQIGVGLIAHVGENFRVARVLVVERPRRQNHCKLIAAHAHLIERPRDEILFNSAVSFVAFVKLRLVV